MNLYSVPTVVFSSMNMLPVLSDCVTVVEDSLVVVVVSVAGASRWLVVLNILTEPLYSMQPVRMTTVSTLLQAEKSTISHCWS